MKKISILFVIFALTLSTSGVFPLIASAKDNHNNNQSEEHSDNHENNDQADSHNNNHDNDEHGDNHENDNHNHNHDSDEHGDDEDNQPTPIDLCANIEGNQETLPEGKVQSGNDCVDVPVTPPTPTTGSITICKIVQDSLGAVIAGSEGSTFTIPFVDADYEGPAIAVPASAVFTTPLSPMQNLFGDVSGECVSYNGLAFGRYYYGEEQIDSPILWELPVYNDQASVTVTNVSELQPFNASLDEQYDNFDGVVSLSVDNTSRTLIVLNKMKAVNQVDVPVDVCANIEGNQENLPEGKVQSGNDCVDIPVTPPVSTGGGNDNNDDNHHSTGGNGPIVGSYGVVNSGGNGQVLGASCGIYLNSYLRFGRNNDTNEVKKLQTFLNEYMGLSLTVSGIFDQATFEAVKQFQLKENDEVIGPWAKLGLLKDKEATGYVFKTTKRRINLIKCAELSIPVPNLLSN